MNTNRRHSSTPSLHLVQIRDVPAAWSDEELLTKLFNRNRKAWREFSRRFDRLIYRCIHKVTSRFRAASSEHDVEEIYAQFLVNISVGEFARLRKFDRNRGSKLSSWLGLLVTNTAWDYLRSVARRPRAVELTQVAEAQDDRASPFDHAVARQRWNTVKETLATFSVTDRRFVELYYLNSLSPQQVASAMNVSVKTIYSKKHKIQNRLKTHMAS